MSQNSVKIIKSSLNQGQANFGKGGLKNIIGESD